MLELSRQSWLWLFVLVGAFFVAWWLARRYRPRRVTYGRIWRRVAARVLPPTWKRVLRTALTWLISVLMLGSVALYAAGLQRPEADRPGPLLAAIVIDNSPSMRAQDRREAAQRRAQEIVDALGEDDRAIVAWFDEGRPMLGRWLKRGDDAGAPPPADFATADLPALKTRLAALRPPPGLPAEPAPVPMAFWLGDAPPELEPADAPARLAGLAPLYDLGVPARVETFGGEARNDAIIDARYTPPEPGDAHGGVIEARTLSGRDPEVVVFADGSESQEVLTGQRVELPLLADRAEVTIRVPGTDDLPHDDAVSMNVTPRRLADVALCHPGGEWGRNPRLVELLEELLPGREVRDEAEPNRVAADLVVLDRHLPDEIDASFVLCFGVIPPSLGRTGEPVDAEPNLQLRVENPGDIGFEAPDFALLHGRDVVPLQEGHGLAPLALHIDGGALIAVRRGETEVLYCGFPPHRSNLLSSPSGLLLLMRWLNAVQETGDAPFAPFVPMGDTTDIELEGPAELTVELDSEAPWRPSAGADAFKIRPTADGRGRIGPFDIPGRYVVSEGGREVGSFTAIWHDPAEQSLPYESRSAADASAMAAPLERDWRDHLPGVLLWIALGGMLLEWLLWLAGITE